VSLHLVPHPTVLVTHLWKYGMYVHMYIQRGAKVGIHLYSV